MRSKPLTLVRTNSVGKTQEDVKMVHLKILTLEGKKVCKIHLLT